jgi:hypothetical protein
MVAGVVIALVAYMVWIYVVVGKNCQCPDKVVPVIDRQRKVHAAITLPPSRPPLTSLPPAVKRTILSNFPMIDQFSSNGKGNGNGNRTGTGTGTGTGTKTVDDVFHRALGKPQEMVDLAAVLAGLPPEHAEAPTELHPSAQAQVAYLTPAKGRSRRSQPNQRLVSVVFLQGTQGGIVFPYFPYTVYAADAQAVLWANVSPSGHVDPRTTFMVLGGTSAWIVHFLNRPTDEPNFQK